MMLLSTPEKDLIAAILIQACKDANSNKERDKYERDKAREWISQAGEDFQDYCDDIGIDPFKFREAVLHKLQEGVI